MAFRVSCCLLVCLTSAVLVWGDPIDKKTTCFARPAYLGEPGTLNCYFDVDVTTLDPRPSFNVRRADNEDFDYNRDTVLDCDWIGNEQLCMTIKDGYRFDGKISNKLTLIMDNVTQEQAGQYYCQLVHSSGAGDIERCTLTVTERTEPRPTLPWTTRPPTTTGIPTEGTAEKKLEAKEGGLGLPLIIAIPVIIVVVLVAVVIVVYMFRRRHIRDDPEKASEHGDSGSISKKDLEKGLSDNEDVFMDDTNQPNVNSTMNEPLLSNNPADDEAPADDERQEPSAENDNDSGYIRLANQDQDTDRNVVVSLELPTQAGGDNEQREDEISDEDEDDGIEEALEKADKAGPLSVGTPRTRRIQKKLKPVVNEIKQHGVEFLHPVPDEFKRQSAQRQPRNVQT